MNKIKISAISNRFLRIFYCLTPIFVSCGAVLFFGKDVNADAINYHAYAAFGLLEGRINVDFFPSGPQSYLNPVGYLPFYFFRQWFSDIWVSMALAVLHSTSIYAVVYLLNEFFEKSKDYYSYYLAIVCALLTTVFWQVVGSSFVDAYVCALVLFGSLYFIRSFKSYSYRECCSNLMLSAFFLGLASGLKLTALLFCLAAGITLFVFSLKHPRKWKHLFMFTGCGVFGFFLIEGWWAYLVYERTGNPFFPYFNNLFQSPFYPSQSIGNERFTPEGWVDALLFPIYAVMPAPWLYQELRAPDVRFFVFFLLLFAVLIFRLKQIKANPSSAAAIIFYLMSYVLWLCTTGNGRYGIHLFLMPGIFILWFLSLFFNKSNIKIILVLIVAIQSVLLWAGAAGRYSQQEFSDRWIDYDIPVELKKVPALYISLDVNSFSFLAEELHRESIFTNMAGQLLLPKTPELDAFLNEAIHKTSNIRFISRAMQDALPRQDMSDFAGAINPNSIRNYLYVINTRLSRLAMRVVHDGCVYIKPKSRAYYEITPLIVSCKVAVDVGVYAEFKRQVVAYDNVFDQVERKCSGFFNPKTSYTERAGDLWVRKYLGAEVRMYVSMGSVWIDFSDRLLPINLGAFADLVKSVDTIDCENSVPRMSHDVW